MSPAQGLSFLCHAHLLSFQAAAGPLLFLSLNFPCPLICGLLCILLFLFYSLHSCIPSPSTERILELEIIKSNLSTAQIGKLSKE